MFNRNRPLIGVQFQRRILNRHLNSDGLESKLSTIQFGIPNCQSLLPGIKFNSQCIIKKLQNSRKISALICYLDKYVNIFRLVEHFLAESFNQTVLLMN